MHLDHLLFPRDSSLCAPCPDAPPPCNCNANQHCFQTARSCDACASFQCIDDDTSSGSGSGGPSGGAIAGAVIGSLVFLGIVVAAYFWWRRRAQQKTPASAPETGIKDKPAPAETVLNRPDPNGQPISPPPRPIEQRPVDQVSTVRVYSTNSNSIIDLDPERSTSSGAATTAFDPSRSSVQSNPFVDGHSILTTSTGTQSTNVIPIAFVPPGSVAPVSPRSQNSQPPSRPPRSPDAYHSDHLNVSHDGSRRGAPSMRSDISGVSSRQSYMSGASFASDMLSEAPTIITQSQRQVLGIVKAEVIQAPGSTPSSPLTATTSASRPPTRSPLAATSFGPQDVLREEDETQTLSTNSDPFGDDHSPNPARSSIATYGNSSDHHGQPWTPEAPSQRWQTEESSDGSRPISMYTQAASIIGADIRDATRVHLGLVQPTSASFVPATPVSSSHLATPRSPYRMTSGRLVTPSSGANPDVLARQQERALAEVQAARAQNFDAKRMSMSTVASGASGAADSILESFTFVPPSPISNRPARTPVRSPLAEAAPVTDNAEADDSPLPSPRRIQGLSTGSQLSAMSTGLGSFPFQIDHGNGQASEPPSSFPPAGAGRQRASLDTLALTSDLSSYPLKFDIQPKDSSRR